MRKIILIILSVLMLSGCHSLQYKGVCRHSAMYAALVYGEHYPVRLVSGECTNRDCWHVQAQYKTKDGEWKWLETNGYWVWSGDKDWWFKPPYTYRTPKQYLLNKIKTKIDTSTN